MKKYLLAILILILLAIPGIALASDITDALYYGTIQISNNGTAASQVSTTLSLNSTKLIDVYDIDTDFDYVAVRNSAGSDVAFMPGHDTVPWCLWVPSIDASASINYILYTGQSDLGATKYYFPGDGGMAVNDDASIEFGDNGSVQVTNYANISNSLHLIGTSTGNETAGTSHTVTLPSSSDGNLIIVAFATYSGAAAITFPGGWTKLFDDINNPNSLAVYYRVADGSETSTITVTTATGSYSGYTAYSFEGQIGNPEVGTAATGSSANPDPPSLTPSWATYDTLWIAVAGWASVSAETLISYPTNFYDGIYSVWDPGGTGAGAGMAILHQLDDAMNPGIYTLSGVDTWIANTIAIKGETKIFSKLDSINACYRDGNSVNATIYGGASVVASSISDGEHKFEVYADTTNLYIKVDDVLKDTAALGGVSAPDNANDWIIGNDGSTPYIETANITVNGVLGGSWRWEYGATFTDLSGHGNDATPTFRTTSSDADVTATLTAFAPINLNIPPAYTVENAPDFITGNITTSGQFTTGNISTTGGPPGFNIVTDLATQGETPNIWVFGIIALCLISGGQLFWVWMQRRYNFRSMWPMFATGLLIMGLFVALGGTVKIFDFWMVVFYIVIFICLMVMSRHTEVGGNVSTHGMIGFAAQSWIGLTLINKMLEGTFVGSSETAWVNTFAFTQEFKLFNMFSMPVLNLEFWTKGIPSLLRWDYSFFGGNAQLFQYLLYSLTAVVAFIIFGLLIGLLYNFFRGR